MRHRYSSSHSQALNDIIQNVDQQGTQREGLHQCNSIVNLYPIMLPSISKESLLSSARNTSNQSAKTSHLRENEQLQSHSPVSQFQQQYFDAIKNDNCQQALTILINMMILSVDQDNLSQLIKIFRVASLTLLHFQRVCKIDNIHKEYNIFKRICSRFRNHLMGITTFWESYANNYKNMRLEKSSLKSVESIEFAWFMQNLDEELRCYEELGKLCYFNHELNLAKQLHEMSMVGNQRSDSILNISKKGIQQLINNYPPQQISIDQNILSKIIDFPFVIRATKEERDTQNRYLRLKNQNVLLLTECILKVQKRYQTKCYKIIISFLRFLFQLTHLTNL
ncbi:unnamed protein product [Paramecium octaurelia]|uniref:Uncharacterized protein n=1 Tax=Paramecium octaurelia TaxID=43137 RepID=A0A8S1SYJ2_PAROT|nr:unnamed protein product [Paramecium octaurelia]